MNVTAHQEKEKNKETKTGKKKAGKDRIQATNFREAVCFPFAVVQGKAQQKMKGSARGNWDPQEGQQPLSIQPKRGQGPHHHVEAAVDWCRSIQYRRYNYIDTFQAFVKAAKVAVYACQLI